MTLSLILILLLPLLLFLPIFLPRNKTRFYTICATLAAAPILVLYLLNLFFPSLQLQERIGNIFFVFSAFLYANRVELSQAEMVHLSCNFFYLYSYILVYILSSIVVKLLFIGQNPAIQKPISTIRKVFDALLFFVLTYGILFFFLVDIRILFPFGDGFLSPLMNMIYRIGR